MQTLRIFNDFEHLVTLTWNRGVLLAHDLHPDFASAVERWRRQGVTDWVLDEERLPTPRITTVADPMFLLRLRDRIRRQFPHQQTVLSFQEGDLPLTRGGCSTNAIDAPLRVLR